MSFLPRATRVDNLAQPIHNQLKRRAIAKSNAIGDDSPRKPFDIDL
jgi:hypothetical protein